MRVRDHVVTGPSEPEFVALLRRQGVDFVTGVADSEFRSVIEDLEQSVGDFYFLAARENHAVALAAGAALAGDTVVVFMESSGVGNIGDVVTSLVSVYEIPMVLWIAWAGYQGRDVPHHNVIGERLQPFLAALGIETSTMPMSASPQELAEGLGVPRKFSEGHSAQG